MDRVPCITCGKQFDYDAKGIATGKGAVCSYNCYGKEPNAGVARPQNSNSNLYGEQSTRDYEHPRYTLIHNDICDTCIGGGNPNFSQNRDWNRIHNDTCTACIAHAFYRPDKNKLDRLLKKRPDVATKDIAKLVAQIPDDGHIPDEVRAIGGVVAVSDIMTGAESPFVEQPRQRDWDHSKIEPEPLQKKPETWGSKVKRCYMSLRIRKCVVFSLVGLVFLVPHLGAAVKWLSEHGVMTWAEHIRTEYITGTALAVIVALMILLTGKPK